MYQRMKLSAAVRPLAWLIAGGMIVATAMAQSAPEQAASPEARGASAAANVPAAAEKRKISPYSPVHPPGSAKDYYLSVWGVDSLLVRQTASGNLIRFSYRVTDPARAQALGDKHATPFLFGQRSKAVLHIPVMDKIGQLRQSGAAEAGKEYWMVFSNKGNLVKPGDRVDVVIGSFHADGLTVE
ncbi:MAG TPA: hypothetical protein VIU93_08980 [Gallionellaceae bacterium]